MIMKLQQFADYLESYSGRDRVMRIIYYSSCLIGGLTKSKQLQTKLEIFSDQINSCRTVLRLFDSIPMLCYTRSYGLGREDPDLFMRICALAVNLFDQIYYPLEHIAWAADCKLISLQSEPWWTASSFCWAISMYLMTLKEMVSRKLAEAQLAELLTAARCLLDLIQAVHWLPSGVLWAGKLSLWQIGAVGVASSILSIVQASD